MEENEQQSPDSMLEITLSQNAINSLYQICKWVHRFVILTVATIAAGGLLLFTAWDEIERAIYPLYGRFAPGFWIGIFLGLVVYAVLLSLLFNFAYNLKKGIDNVDMQKAEQGVAGLRAYFIATGVLTILYTFLFLLEIAFLILR